MDYLPAAVHKWIEGSIDPHSQQLIETYSQTYLIAVTIVAFLISYTTGSVLLSLEVFLGALGVLLLVTVPPWSMYQRRRVKFLPVRKS